MKQVASEHFYCKENIDENFKLDWTGNKLLELIKVALKLKNNFLENLGSELLTPRECSCFLLQSAITICNPHFDNFPVFTRFVEIFRFCAVT